MSHFTKVTTQFKDKECLTNALKLFFKEIETHNEKHPLYGYKGDQRTQSAEIIIRKQYVGRASNDIGFSYNPETQCYEAYISEYDVGHHEYNDEWLNELKVQYAEEVIKKQAAKDNAKIERTVLENGSIQYKLIPKQKQKQARTKQQVKTSQKQLRTLL